MPRAGAEVRAYLAAAGCAGEVLGQPAVGVAWDEPSTLPEMTVGALAGHLYLTVRRLDQHLDEPELPLGPAESQPSYEWIRVVTAADLDRPEHRVVRDHGGRVAAWGWEAVATAYAERVAKLEVRLAEPLPATVTLGGGAFPFAAYVETRIVELLVHADDLAVSVNLPRLTLPSEAADLAIGALTVAARSVHGDLNVLRALTRSERTEPPIPSVY